MSKPTKEEIDLEINRDCFKNKVLNELKLITNHPRTTETQLYYEKNKIHLQHLPQIYIMANIEDLKKAITRKKAEYTRWQNNNNYIIKPVKIPNPFPN